jgi:hypothetical protein
MVLHPVFSPIKNSRRFVPWTRNKEPLDPTTGRKAKCNESSTWSTYPDAVATAAHIDGHVGFVPGHDYLVLDFDAVVVLVDGEIQVHPWVQQWIDSIGGYTELSVSGTGIHITVPMSDSLRTLLPHKKRIESGEIPIERVELIVGNNGVIFGREIEAPMRSVEEQQATTISFVEHLLSLNQVSPNRQGKTRKLSSPERAILNQHRTGDIQFDENLALAARTRGGDALRAYFVYLWVKRLDSNGSGHMRYEAVIKALTEAFRAEQHKTPKKTARRIVNALLDLGFAERLSPAVIRLRSPNHVADLLGTRLGRTRPIPVKECLTRTPKRSVYLGIARDFDGAVGRPRPISRAVRREKTGVCAATQRRAEKARGVKVEPNYVIGSPRPSRSWRYLHDGRTVYPIANSTEVHPVSDPERLDMRVVRHTDRRTYFYPDLDYGNDIAKLGDLLYLGKASLDDGELVNLWEPR